MNVDLIYDSTFQLSWANGTKLLIEMVEQLTYIAQLDLEEVLWLQYVESK